MTDRMDQVISGYEDLLVRQQKKLQNLEDTKAALEKENREIEENKVYRTDYENKLKAAVAAENEDAITEVEEEIEKQQGKVERTLETAKATFVNLALDTAKTNEKLNEILRERILAGKKEMSFASLHDRKLREGIRDLLSHLPQEDLRLWKYGMKAMEPYREEIDHLSDLFLQGYFKKEYTEYENRIKALSEAYRDSYGNDNKGRDFETYKRDDLYYRLGNAILSECRTFQLHRVQQSGGQSGKSRTGSKVESKAWDSYGDYLLGNAITAIRRAAKEDFQSQKNQAAYERMGREAEYLKQNL